MGRGVSGAVRPSEDLPLICTAALVAGPQETRGTPRRLQRAPGEAEAVSLEPAGDVGPSGQRPAGAQRALAALLALLALLLLAAAARVVHWRRGTGQGRRQPLGDAVILEGGSDCIVEDDVDYWTHRPISQEGQVWSAEGCRERCEGHPKCGAWTWGKARHHEGLTDMCFLMELDHGLLPSKTRRIGVTSGLPCNKTQEGSFDQVVVERWLALLSDIPTTSSEPTVAAVVSSISTTAAAAEEAAHVVVPAASAADSDADRAPEATAAEAVSVAGLDPASTSACGPVEEDVAYWVWSLLGEMHNVPTASECREKCALVPGCGAWTWGKARGVDGLSDICFLKGQGSRSFRALQDSRHPSKGVSSGLCSAEPAAEHASPRMAIVLVPGDGGVASWSDTIVPASSLTGSNTRSPTTATTTLTRTRTTSTTTRTRTKTITRTTSTSSTTRTTSTATSTTTLTSANTLTSETSTTHTRTTSTKTESSSTTTVVPIVFPEKADGELFCFAVMIPGSEEQSLLVIAFQNMASIFQCDKSTVYSSQELELAPGVVTHRVASDLLCDTGGEFNTALNLEIFLEVWGQVVRDGDFTSFEWTVKADPDSVFFPNRLRAALKDHPVADHELGVYLNNCEFGLHGPIEVFSRHAVKTWWEGSQRCLDHFWEECEGDCKWGEDLFIDQCLWKVLGAKREDEDSLLVEDHCSPPEGWRSCQDSWHVAFHPFKTGWEWMQCFESAKAYKG